MQAEKEDLVLMPFFVSVGGVFWGSQARARSVNSNQKIRVLVNPIGRYLRVHKPNQPWEAGWTVDHKGCWACPPVGNLRLLETPRCCLGLCLHEGGSVSFGSLQAAWPHKLGAERGSHPAA